MNSLDQNKILIAGLGNPGKEYANTPHNIGFHFMDFLKDAWDLGRWRSKYQAHVSEKKFPEKTVILLMPQTFMNLSGSSVKAALVDQGIPTSDLIVIHDEVDMAPGQWGIKESGGHRGHNGIRHIISALKENSFLRIRIGVGRPNHPDLADYLLARFTPGTLEEIRQIFPQIQAALEKIILEGAPGVSGRK